MFHPFGFEFAPRISDLSDKRIYVPGKPGDWPNLAPIIGGPPNLKRMEQQFDGYMRLVVSVKHGSVTASLILRKLASYPRQNSLTVAVREFGRVERRLFKLRYIRNPSIRHRISAGLAKGEPRNALARAIFFHRLGEIPDRSYQNQRIGPAASIWSSPPSRCGIPCTWSEPQPAFGSTEPSTSRCSGTSRRWAGTISN